MDIPRGELGGGRLDHRILLISKVDLCPHRGSQDALVRASWLSLNARAGDALRLQPSRVFDEDTDRVGVWITLGGE
jgi:hypothetical protein